MSQFTDAADAIRRQTKQLEQMQFAASVLDNIGSLDNGVKEALAAKAAAEQERDVTLAELSSAKEDVKKARHTCKQLLDDASVKASVLVADAQRQADTHIADMDALESAKLRDATTAADAIRTTAAMTLEKLTADIQALEARKVEVEATTALAEARLAKAEKQFDLMRDKLAAMVA